MASEETISNARAALPHLVRAARLETVLQYGEICQRIGLTDPMDPYRKAPHLLGYIRDDICVPRGLPMINCLVVNGDTRLPGDGFLPGGEARGLTDAEKHARFRAERAAIFACEAWEDLLAELGLPPLAADDEVLDREAVQYARFLERNPGAEGEAHNRLKRFVAENPSCIGLAGTGSMEFPFPSGDRCDVVIELLSGGVAVVEIKKGSLRGELVQGVYQTIKYRALMEAQRGRGNPFPVSAHVAAYRIPDEVRAFSKQFRISCHEVAI